MIRNVVRSGLQAWPPAAPMLVWPQPSPMALRAMPDEVLARSRSTARRAQLASGAARRLRTGCVGEELYDETHTILVTREWPLHLAEDGVHEWWPALTPSLTLVRMRRGANNAPMSWEEFAARYQAELDALPLHTQQTYLVWLGYLLAKHPSVTLLSCEPSRGRLEAAIQSQRRVLYDWLLS